MADGIFQSAIVFFMGYLVFAPANFVSENGLNIDDTTRIGVYIATAAVIVVNFYVLFNTYRWDWLMLTIVAVSILLIWFWTGVYTSFKAGFTFHGAAAQVYGQVTFWASLFLTTVICLLPRFCVKAIQKIYFPLPVDIIREQVRMGQFDYLKDSDSLMPPSPDKVQSLSSSEEEAAEGPGGRRGRTRMEGNTSEDMRPIYPPSVAPTATTQHTRGQNGSDGSNYTDISHDISRPADTLERPIMPRGPRELSRPSFDRARMSMDRIRPSFEQSRDFTSASRLMRLESSQSGTKVPLQSAEAESSGTNNNLTGIEKWKRRLTRASEKSVGSVGSAGDEDKKQ